MALSSECRWEPIGPEERKILDAAETVAARTGEPLTVRILTEHPWAIGPLFASPSPGIGAATLGERFLGILARGGLTGEPAVAAFTGILALNYGRTAFTAGGEAPELPPLPAARFPHSAASAAALAGYAGDANYRRALELLLDGIRGAAS